MASHKKQDKKTIKHGAYIWLRDNKIHPSIRGHRRLQKYLDDLEKDLSDQVGELTSAKEILIKTIIEAYGFILLASLYCKREGILNPKLLEKGIISLQPVLSTQFIAFMNSCRQSLVVLGLDKKKAEKVFSLDKIKEEYKEKE